MAASASVLCHYATSARSCVREAGSAGGQDRGERGGGANWRERRCKRTGEGTCRGLGSERLAYLRLPHNHPPTHTLTGTLPFAPGVGTSSSCAHPAHSVAVFPPLPPPHDDAAHSRRPADRGPSRRLPRPSGRRRGSARAWQDPDTPRVSRGGGLGTVSGIGTGPQEPRPWATASVRVGNPAPQV